MTKSSMTKPVFATHFKWQENRSVLVCLLIFIYVIKSTIDISPWKQKPIISQDVVSYYAYLPAVFIYHDLEFHYASRPGFKGTVWCLPTPTGKGILKMTMGTAVLYAPFFGVAHLYEKLSGGPADGYSISYHIALIWAGVCYFIVGILLLRKILVRYFSDWVVSALLISISLGTNLYNYASWDGAMSHVYSFFMFALAVWAFLRWLESSSFWNTIVLGFALGMVVLIRPTNAALILFLSLYFWNRDLPMRAKWEQFVALKWKLLLLAFVSVLVCVPQLLYWKVFTGQYFFFSYQGERFFFDRPQIMSGLFSYHKGWFVYTPLMVLAGLGIFQMKGKLKEWRWPTVITMPLIIYVIFSWWCWWYGGGFSARALVEYYVIMAFPLGAFYTFIIDQNLIIRIATTASVIFLIWLNIFQSEQYRSTLLHYDAMSKAAYWGIWGTQRFPKDYDKLIVPLNAEKAKKGESAFPN